METEAVIHGEQLCTKMLSQYLLLNMQVSGMVFSQIPPKGILTTNGLEHELTSSDDVLAKLNEIKSYITSLKDKLSIKSFEECATVIDKHTVSKTNLTHLNKSCSALYSEYIETVKDIHPEAEMWNADNEKWPQISRWLDSTIKPLSRNNPIYKNEINAYESIETGYNKMLTRRLKTKKLNNDYGNKNKKVFVKNHMSKNRQLHYDTIPELVGFMPKLSAYLK